MSEITATFVVEPFDITIQSPTSNINVTPTVLDVNIFSGGYSSPGGNFTELQYNAGGVLGGISVATFSNGNVSFSNIGNLKLPGGSNAYFLQTDGTGNLTWAQGTANVSGNGTAAGANTQIQISDGTGNFTSGPGFTFDVASNLFSVPGNGYFASNVTAQNFIGNLVGNANYASYAGIVVTPIQPNITQVGNLSLLNVTGNLTALNANITSLLTAVTGNITSINATNGNFVILRSSDTEIALGLDAGSITQANGAIALGTDAGRVSQGENSIAIGYSAGENAQANYSVAIGKFAGYDGQGSNSIAIGANAGTNFQDDNTIVLNATGANLDTTVANSFVVKPVRNANTSNVIFYNNSTGEITYDNSNAITTLGNLTSLTVNGNVTINGNYSFVGTGTVQQIKEKVTSNATGATGTINFDLLDSAILNKTANATANFTLNFRGNSTTTLNNVMNNNESLTCSFLNTNGVTAYVANVIKIDGTNVIPYWSGAGSVGTGTVNGKDLYTFNIIKTAANTYTVLATRSGLI